MRPHEAHPKKPRLGEVISMNKASSAVVTREQVRRNQRMCRAAHRIAKTHKRWGRLRARLSDFSYIVRRLDLGDIQSQVSFLIALEVELRNRFGNDQQPDIWMKEKVVPILSLIPGRNPRRLWVEIRNA